MLGNDFETLDLKKLAKSQGWDTPKVEIQEIKEDTEEEIVFLSPEGGAPNPPVDKSNNPLEKSEDKTNQDTPEKSEEKPKKKRRKRGRPKKEEVAPSEEKTAETGLNEEIDVNSEERKTFGGGNNEEFSGFTVTESPLWQPSSFNFGQDYFSSLKIKNAEESPWKYLGKGVLVAEGFKTRINGKEDFTPLLSREAWEAYLNLKLRLSIEEKEIEIFSVFQVKIAGYNDRSFLVRPNSETFEKGKEIDLEIKLDNPFQLRVKPRD